MNIILTKGYAKKITETYSHLLYFKGVQRSTTDYHLQPVTIRINFGHLTMKSLNQIIISLFQQSISFIQHKESTAR